MDIEVRWLKPFDLVRSKSDLIYEISGIDSVPSTPGVYVFARAHGDVVCPLYVGKAGDLRKRVEQQLNNLKLMRAIERAPNGYRVLYVAEFLGKGGQDAMKAVSVVESAFISAAMVEGFELINVQGTKTLAHTITSTGNREARSWLPESVIRLRKA
ncbi:MAG: GIY-YIG nuclease family protein [Rhizobacter sp.]|nr:GIY-YIG nuclease family protein [Rhizobacter sp.]